MLSYARVKLQIDSIAKVKFKRVPNYLVFNYQTELSRAQIRLNRVSAFFLLTRVFVSYLAP